MFRVGATAALLGAVAASPAFATRLEVAADAPAWAHGGAAALLVGHIGGGAIGILSGAVALAARKGARVHRAAGAVFVAAMFVCYAIATLVAPFLAEGQVTNTIAGASALYLLISGVATARTRVIAASRWHGAGFALALSILASSLWFNYRGSLTPEGSIDGSPPQALAIFIFAASVAAAGELHVLLRGRLPENARIARHLWRMCFSLFIAAGSFFLGQQKVMPEWMRGSPVLFILALAPLAALLFFIIRIRIGRSFKEA
ncbi:MAG: hypothetical protein HXY21_14220 [Parvularculaceae bacterium]|nr:hypothetical protein [Parvularculaceae bacterium]